MSKRNIMLYLDDEIISLAKLKGINISEQLNSYLKVLVGCDLELPQNQKDINDLKKIKEEELGKLKSELETINNQLKDLKKQEDDKYIKTITFNP